MIFRLLLALALATAALGQTYVVSDSSTLRILDACGDVNSTLSVTATNLQARGSVVYYQSGSVLHLLHPNGTTSQVCSGCLPLTPWVIEGSTVIGYGITGITTQALGSSSSTNVYTPSGPNSVEGVAVAGSVVYWLENVPGGTTELWAAGYPGFTNPTRNLINLVFEYTHIVKGTNVVYLLLDGRADAFEPRASPDLSIRTLDSLSYPAGITSASLAPAGAGWAIGGVGGLAEGFSTQCTKNITTDTARGLAVFGFPQACPGAPCWQAAPTTTTTSDAVRPSPMVLVGFCFLMGVMLFV